jgi:hypothetical protein
MSQCVAYSTLRGTTTNCLLSNCAWRASVVESLMLHLPSWCSITSAKWRSVGGEIQLTVIDALSHVGTECIVSVTISGRS